MERFVKHLHFKHFSLIFMVIYVLIVLLVLTGLDWQSSISLGDHSYSVLQQGHNQRLHSAFKPRKPWLQDRSAQTDGCHYAPDSLLRPVFTKLDNTTYFLNAFYDTRIADDPHMLVLTVRPRSEEGPLPPVYCLVNDAHNHTLHAITSRPYPLRDATMHRYQTFILTCPVKDIIYSNPCKVRLSLGKQMGTGMVTLPLLSLPQRQQARAGFAVCTPPFHGAISQTRIVENIELQRILGADHFYVYQYTGDMENKYSNPNTEQVLRYYNSTNMVTIYDWKLPVHSKLIADYGATAAMHHCLYTNMLRHKYLLVSDIYSVLIPKLTDDWASLMELIDDGNHIIFCCKMAFFPPRAGEHTISMSSIHRTLPFTDHPTHCILAQPQQIFQMASTNVQKWGIYKGSPKAIRSRVALLHRYQRCSEHSDVECSELTEDSTALRYKDAFLQAYRRVTQALLDYDYGAET